MSQHTYTSGKKHPNLGSGHHSRRASRSARERGVALLITLGLLALLGAASLAVIFLTSSDAMINGYYRNYRGSFYAADSGINVVVEAMKNAIATSGNPASVGTTPPLPISGALVNSPSVQGTAATPAALTAAYTPYTTSAYSIGDPGSWNSQFQVVTNPKNAPVLGTPSYQYTLICPTGDNSCPADGTAVYAWSFDYPYEVTVKGQSSGSEAEEITESGVIQYNSSPGSAAGGGLPSFSHFAGFIDQFALCQGALVPGTMYGPFFTNGSWNFGNFSSPGYTFEGSIGQAGSQVGWINGGCTQGGSTAPRGFHQPSFTQGFGINQPQIQEPTDSYNQEEAVLDAKGCTQVPCSASDQANIAAEMPSVLKTVNGTAYSSSTTGVFLPMHPDATNPGQMDFGGSPTVTGSSGSGGFLVNGNASVTLTATNDSANNPTQTYAITQGGTTTTIVVDAATNTTTVSQGSGSPLTLVGVPTQLNPTTGNTITQDDPSGNPVAPTMVYVNGTITGLSGTIQNNAGITVTSSSNIDITGNLTYVSQPVTSTDSLVSNTNAGVLGIYTNGDVNLEPSTNGGNLTIDASIAMIGSGNSGLETPGKAVGTLTIMGGRSEDQAHGVNMSASNTMYDQRFAGNFGPPWFPTAVPTAGTPSIPSNLGITVYRTSWQPTSLQQ